MWKTGDYHLDVQMGDASISLLGRVQLLHVYESIYSLLPTAEMVFSDVGGLYQEVLPFTGTELVSIGIGKQVDGLQYHTFKAYEASVTPGQTGGIFTMNMVSEYCDALLRPKRFTSFPSSKISQAVSTMVSLIALSHPLLTSEVETTREAVGSLFCPGWSYSQFLTWLGSIARSNSYNTAGYVGYITLDNKLHFVSLDYLMKKGKVASLVMTTKASTDIKVIEYKPLYYTGPALSHGGYGHTRSYYDFVTGTWKKSEQTFSSSSHGSLSDFTAIDSGSEDAALEIVNGGVSTSSREEDFIEARAESVVTMAIDSMIRLEVLVYGSTDLHAGSKVTVVLPSVLHSPANDAISGGWLIERLTHSLVPNFYTRLTLCRSGVNGAVGRDVVEGRVVGARG